MYFEDLYNKISPLWNKEFSLENLDNTETYVQSLRENYNDIENIVDFTNKEDYNEWESMLVFTMYQALTSYALNEWNTKRTKVLRFNEIPIMVFEDYYRKNIEEEGNENFLKEYQGFKNPL
jgi:hypothetical protein